MRIRRLFCAIAVLLSVVARELKAASAARLLTDLNAGSSGSYPSNFTAFGGNVLFSAYTLATGFELWKYNGSTVSLVADINPTADDIGFGVMEGNDSLPTWLTPYNGQLYFSAYEPTRGAELWRYDGNTATRVSDIAPDLNDTIKIFPNNAWPSYLTVFSNVLYLSATTRTNPENYELWSYDGANVRLAANIHPDIGVDYSSYPKGLTVFDNGLYFMAADAANGWELFRFDGTTAHLININPGGSESSSYPKYFTAFGGQLYFQAFTDAEGFELWRTDGTNTTIVADLMPGAESSYAEDLTVFNGALYFSGVDPLHGAELHRYDGSQVTLAAEINPTGDAYPKNLTVFGDSLMFAANDGMHGWELWKFDGTNATMVTDLNTSGDSFPEDLTVVGDALYFTATTPETGYEVFRYDGVSVAPASDINPGAGDSFPSLLKAIGNQLFFRAADDGASNWEPWVIEENPPVNQGPIVSLTAPTNGTTFLTTDTITFSADASDDVAVSKVEFYANGTLVGEDASAAYSVTASLPAGAYAVYAKAIDNQGVSRNTDPITIRVQNATVTQPTIASVTQSGGNIVLEASASDGAQLTLEATTDFVNWTTVGTATAVGGKATFTQPTSGTMAFYRVVAH